MPRHTEVVAALKGRAAASTLPLALTTTEYVVDLTNEAATDVTAVLRDWIVSLSAGQGLCQVTVDDRCGRLCIVEGENTLGRPLRIGVHQLGIPVADGKLAIGPLQRIIFAPRDGFAPRRLRVLFIGDRTGSSGT